MSVSATKGGGATRQVAFYDHGINKQSASTPVQHVKKKSNTRMQKYLNSVKENNDS